MITKTYLDGKLNQLEERLKRRIDMKDERTLCEIEVEVRNLKEHIKNLAHYEELENLSHKEILWDSKVIDTINEVIE